MLPTGVTTNRAKQAKGPRSERTMPPVTKLTLDDFQIEAAEALREGLSVLVSAPTEMVKNPGSGNAGQGRDGTRARDDLHLTFKGFIKPKIPGLQEIVRG